MQLITLASAAALAAGVAASEFNKMGSFDPSLPRVRVINRCPYKVYLWSVLKGQGCPSHDGTILETGDFYQENHRIDAVTGVSIKISRSDRCKGVDCTQLEYFIDPNPSFNFNFLDVSYVDCLDGDCPSRQEGFYLKSGNQDGKYQTAGADRAICPILSCSNAEECGKMAYLFPDDTQTKSCDPKADLDFYMCGGEAPGEESDYSVQPAPSSSSSSKVYEQPKPTTTSQEAPPSVYHAEVTPAPEVSSKKPNVKTETKVVYVTEYEYANAKRHEHAHAHAHAHHKFRA